MNKKSKIIASFFMFLMIIFVLMIILAPNIAKHDPFEIKMTMTIKPPSTEHILGTDILGRDIFSRILYGGRVSLFLAIVSTFLSLTVGLLLGLVSGYYMGKTDHIITILTNIFQGLPGTCMIIAISAMLKPGIKTLLFALVITNWANFSRVVRGEVIKTRGKTFIQGAKSIGASNLRIMFLYILPDILPDLVVIFAGRVASNILQISGLSYLGLGIQPPTPDWGGMISEARTGFRTNPVMILAPGLSILIVSLGINYGTEILRNRWSKKSVNVGDM